MPDEKCIVNPERDCIGKAAAIKLESRIERLEDGQKKESEFRELYYKERLERAKRDAEMDAKISSMDEKLDKLLSKQEETDAKPGKLLDTLKNNAIWAVLAAVIGFVLGKIGF